MLKEHFLIFKVLFNSLIFQNYKNSRQSTAKKHLLARNPILKIPIFALLFSKNGTDSRLGVVELTNHQSLITNH